MDKQTLCKNISYNFRNIGLLEAALSHRSAQGKNNERLEFLGDSILNFTVAELLYFRFPKIREGELSRLRAYLVKGETLAKLAQEFELGSYLRLGSGELKSGGYRRQSILADAMEAIVAAIYLDAGMDECKQCIKTWYESRIYTLETDTLSKDPKSELQEYLQSKRFALPYYEITKIEGMAHAQTFTVRCTIHDLNFYAESTGNSRRRAEQEAAAKVLKQLKSTEFQSN